jgi:DNA-binding transcriptional MerR regulator
MGITVKVYQPYAEVHGTEYYSIGTVSEIIGKSNQTIRLWDSWCGENNERLIPQSTRIGKNMIRCWSEEEIEIIRDFSKNLKYGDIAQISRTRWGERSNNLRFDRSTETRKAVKEKRAQVNKDAKKVQNQRKIDEIKQARGNMIKTIRRRAQSVISSVHED